MAMSIVWITCLILTKTGALEEGSYARTDLHPEVITEAPWFSVPYPCKNIKIL